LDYTADFLEEFQSSVRINVGPNMIISDLYQGKEGVSILRED